MQETKLIWKREDRVMGWQLMTISSAGLKEPKYFILNLHICENFENYSYSASQDMFSDFSAFLLHGEITQFDL